MKKSLLALAVAGAFSGAAFAQSSVVLFGIVDTGYSYYKGDNNGNVKAMTNSGLNSSRLGVRGSEDLGGGLKANFWLEGSVTSDNGTGAGSNTNNQTSGGGLSTTTTYAAGAIQPNGVACAPVAPATTCSFTSTTAANGTQGFTFNRRMFVGMSGGFGEFRLGRNYTPIFLQITGNDPFGTNGIGQTAVETLAGLVPGGTLVVTNVRASNELEYLTPPGIGGVYVHAQYALGENASTAANANDGRSLGGRVGWAGGPVDVSLAYNKTTLLQSATQGNYTVMGVGGTLTFGAFKPMLQYLRHKIDISAGTDPERADILAGIVMSFGATDIRASYNRHDVKNTSNDGQQIAIGAVYNLSRRTAVYGTISQMDNKGTGTLFVAGAGSGRATTQPGGKSQGLDLGVRHSF